MRRATRWGVGAAMLSAVVVGGGCDRPDDPDGDAGLDVGADVKPDVTLPDAATPDVTSDALPPDHVAPPDDAKNEPPPTDVVGPETTPPVDVQPCPDETVWATGSAKLRLVQRRSPPLPTGPHDCKAATVYEYAPAARSLKQSGCLLDRPVDRMVELNEEPNRRLLAEVEALRTACRTTCLEGEGVQTLAIEDANSCAQSVYISNERTGCASADPFPPYVDSQTVRELGTSFALTMHAACRPDGAGSDVGKCLVSDGGSSACRAADKPDDAAVSSLRESSVSVDVVPDVPTEAGPDGSTCTIDPVWNEESLSFALNESGGVLLPPDSGCFQTAVSYSFSKQTKTLSRSGCYMGRGVREEVVLVGAQIDAILAAVTALRTTCQKSCVADLLPELTFNVTDCAGQAQGTYRSNYYAGCLTPTAPPYIGFADLLSLRNLVDGTIKASCEDVDAGSAGVCRPFCRR